MSAVEQGSEEQWHVQVTKGDVRLWTLDQLDAAFKAELVDESTYVLEVGKTEWMQLGILLGLGEEEPPAPAAVPIIAQVAYVAPEPLVPSVAPVALGALGESPSLGPYSTAPIAADLDDLDSPAAFRSSKKGPKLIGAGIALALAAAAAFAFTHGTPAPDVSAAAAAVAVAPPPPAPAPPPPPAPAVDAKPVDDPAGTRLSGDQKEKLAALDKVHQARAAARQKSRAAATTHRKGKAAKEKSPFRNGGDKYDPLNAKL